MSNFLPKNKRREMKHKTESAPKAIKPTLSTTKPSSNFVLYSGKTSFVKDTPKFHFEYGSEAILSMFQNTISNIIKLCGSIEKECQNSTLKRV